MPRSHDLPSYRGNVRPRVARVLMNIGLVMCGVAACQSPNRSGADGIETGAVNTDTAGPGTITKADTANPAEARTLRVSSVMIGRRLGAKNQISEPTLRFAPTDTVFVSIATEGIPDSATLAAQWTFPTGRVQDSASTTIQPKGPEHTELHAAPPKGGWPIGSYLVKVFAGGDSVDAKTIAVQK